VLASVALGTQQSVVGCVGVAAPVGVPPVAAHAPPVGGPTLEVA
jgi:hypothetical protein